MCGIVGYIGVGNNAKEVLIKGLKKLEYRGYDSSGVAYINNDSIVHKRAIGEVQNLADILDSTDTAGQQLQLGIAHTRWATHGKPTQNNAHPHTSGDIYLVHNGIIENYVELRDSLRSSGHIFTSETDSEVLAHLIDVEYRANGGRQLAEAVSRALQKVNGAYAIAVLSKSEADEIVVARNSSPIVIGIGDGEYFLASDASVMADYTKRVVYLDDGDVVRLSADSYEFVQGSKKKESEVDNKDSDTELGEYTHFMLKEINDQPEVIADAYRGRIVASEGKVVLGGLTNVLKELFAARRIIIVSCGTSYNAGLVAEHLIEKLAKIPVEVEYASEFRYRNAPLGEGDVVLAISQSGETADTLAAIREAKKCGVLTLGIVNTVGSTISRETDAGVYNHAGKEVSVASTKAFSSQLTVLLLLAILLGTERGEVSKDKAKDLLHSLESLPSVIGEYIFAINNQMQDLAHKYSQYDNALYLGRDIQMPLALEGALKIKEIAYVHAQGHPSGEMKHGPIALIDENMLSIVIVIKDRLYEKSLSTIEEIKARSGIVLAITTQDAVEVHAIADDYITVPEIEAELMPLLTVVPMQLFAYHVAVARGHNVDKPRNLAKSVTVE